MSFANGTLIATPAGTREIETLRIGDTALFGSPAAGATPVVTWKPMTVQFSSGTPPGSKATMVFVGFGDEQSLLCTPDQPLLLGTGLLTRADWLVPGHDALVSGGGALQAVQEVSLGTMNTGVHDIAADMSPPVSLDGHLLIANGVVAGDFELQIYFPQLASSLTARGASLGTRLRQLAQRLFRPDLTKRVAK